MTRLGPVFCPPSFLVDDFVNLGNFLTRPFSAKITAKLSNLLGAEKRLPVFSGPPVLSLLLAFQGRSDAFIDYRRLDNADYC